LNSKRALFMRLPGGRNAVHLIKNVSLQGNPA
jgi:hypothetical protein